MHTRQTGMAALRAPAGALPHAGAGGGGPKHGLGQGRYPGDRLTDLQAYTYTYTYTYTCATPATGSPTCRHAHTCMYAHPCICMRYPGDRLTDLQACTHMHMRVPMY